MNISYNGFNTNVVTMETADDINAGTGVTINSNGKCAAASDGGDIIGVVVNQRERIAGVQLSGYVEMSYTGTAPSYNYVKLVSNGAGGVKVSTTSTKEYKVLKVDTTNKIVGFIL